MTPGACHNKRPWAAMDGDAEVCEIGKVEEAVICRDCSWWHSDRIVPRKKLSERILEMRSEVDEDSPTAPLREALNLEYKQLSRDVARLEDKVELASELRAACEALLEKLYKSHPRGEDLRNTSTEELQKRKDFIGEAFDVGAIIQAREAIYKARRLGL